MRFGQRFWRRRQTEIQLDAELRDHLDRQAHDLIAAGIPPDEAHRQARLRLGGLDQTKERCRDVGGAHWLEVLLQDLRFALRQLRRSPGLTTVAIVTLALAIGANTAIFSLAEAALFPPFAASAPERLIGIYSSGPHGAGYDSVSYPDFDYFRRHSRSLAGAMAYVRADLRWAENGAARTLPAAVVTPNYFQLLGIPAYRGQMLRAGAHASVVVSFVFWQRQLGGSRDAIGRSLTLNGQPFTVVGIAPKDFRGVDLAWGGVPSFWIPMSALTVALPTGPNVNLLTMRQVRFLLVLGRLKPGVSREQARSDLNVLAGQLAAAYPATNAGRTIHVVSVNEARMWPGWRQSVVVVLELLSAAVGLILLLACVNLASLLLARASARRQETATRLALGCSPTRIARQALYESLLLAAAGAGAGLLLAAALLRPLAQVELSPHMHMNLRPTIDGRVLLFTLAVAAVAAVIFGLFPAVGMARRGNLQQVMRAGEARIGSGAGRPAGSRAVLLIVEIALAFVSVAGGVLFVHSLLRLEHTNPGFQPRHLLIAGVSLPPKQFTPEQGARYQAELLRRLRQTPGVAAAALASFAPLSRTHATANLSPADQTTDSSSGLTVETDAVSPGYLSTIGAALLRGREFQASDGGQAPPVAIVNRSLAERLWPGQNPIGRRIRLQDETSDRLIVGVAGDVKRHTMWDQPAPFLYLPLAQQYRPSLALLVRTEGDPAALIATLAGVAARLDPSVALEGVQPMAAVVEASLAQPRLLAVLLGWLAMIGLALALVGIYGLLSYSVSRRRQEIGVRRALGAQPSDILRMVLGEGLRLVAMGIALGLVAGLALGRLATALLRGTASTGDPLLLSLAALVLFATAAAASLVPARRAARLDPWTALRRE